ncbi:AI-2E family transporter [Chungangia koreensis]|uniref:AI-2E family transporter n=1 Tax=Chungangia koreensis TaxID=752657 RepID=A0ABV8X669_9LACT
MDKEKSLFATNFIRFLGGKNTLFLLISILLLGLIIFVFSKISFIFEPIIVLISTIVFPLIVATIAYYLLRGIVKIMNEKLKIPRVWAILLLFLILIGILTTLVVVIYPFLKGQFQDLIKDFPMYFKKLLLDIDHFLRNSIFAPYYTELDVNIPKLVEQKIQEISGFLTGAISGLAVGITNFISAFAGFVLSLVTVPFILFYLLLEGEKLPKFIYRILPPRLRDDAQEVMREADHQISSYIQGQILVSICIGIMVTIGFRIIGLEYALLLGVLAMLTSVVPYLGPVIAITPAAIIALVTSPFMLVKLLIVWTCVQLIEGKFISPQIMGKSLHIHPITIIFVLLTAGSLFGVFGVILGIPGYALLKVVVSHLFKLFQRRYDRYEFDPLKQYRTYEK